MPENSFVAAQTHFAFKLFAALAEHERDKNLFVSPTSIALALASPRVLGRRYVSCGVGGTSAPAIANGPAPNSTR